MKYQLISIGTTGDVAPMIALGGELKRRGGEVDLAAFDDYRQTALESGLSFTPLPGDLKLFIEKLAASGINPVTYIKNLDSFISPIVPTLLSAIYRAMANCDAVVFTFFGTFMYSMAKSLGVKSFEVNFIPLADNSEMPLPIFSKTPLPYIFNPLSHYIADLAIAAFEAYYIGDEAHCLGFKLPKGAVNGLRLARENGVTVLCAFSEALIRRPAKWGDNVYMTGFWDISKQCDTINDEGLQRFIGDHEQILYAGFGSMAAPGVGELFETIASCAAKLDVPLIASTGVNRVNLAQSRDLYVARGFIPHNLLFKSVAYAIHHGGAGTSASAIKAGLPSLVIPFFGDQPFWADMIASRGLGPKSARFGKTTRDGLYEGMKSLVTNGSYAKNALAASRILQKENGVGRACDIIEAKCSQGLR